MWITHRLHNIDLHALSSIQEYKSSVVHNTIIVASLLCISVGKMAELGGFLHLNSANL
jgi:hypothetical protein